MSCRRPGRGEKEPRRRDRGRGGGAHRGLLQEQVHEVEGTAVGLGFPVPALRCGPRLVADRCVGAHGSARGRAGKGTPRGTSAVQGGRKWAALGRLRERGPGLQASAAYFNAEVRLPSPASGLSTEPAIRGRSVSSPSTTTAV